MRSILLIVACGSAGPGAREGLLYADALAKVAANPADAADACGGLQSPTLRGDCLTAGAEALAGTDVAAAAELCAAAPAGLAQDECYFQVAERSGDALRCSDSGRFSQDCAMHLWTRAVRRDLPKGATLADGEAVVLALLPAFHFAADDERPWDAGLRNVLGSQRPYDRPACRALSSDTAQRICLRAALSHYEDRLNHARDTGAFPCDGGPLPPSLAYLPDPDIDAILARRVPGDLCPGAAP